MSPLRGQGISPFPKAEKGTYREYGFIILKSSVLEGKEHLGEHEGEVWTRYLIAGQGKRKICSSHEWEGGTSNKYQGRPERSEDRED